MLSREQTNMKIQNRMKKLRRRRQQKIKYQFKVLSINLSNTRKLEILSIKEELEIILYLILQRIQEESGKASLHQFQILMNKKITMENQLCLKKGKHRNESK